MYIDRFLGAVITKKILPYSYTFFECTILFSHPETYNVTQLSRKVYFPDEDVSDTTYT